MRSAFKKAEFDNPLQEVRNGEQALAYLKGEGPYSDRIKFPLPAVMLLDLNMPKMNGLDVLTWVRSQPVLKRMVIIILTASMRGQDVECAFDLGATSFLVKPSNIDALISMIRCLRDWIAINQFPQLHQAARTG